MTDLIAFARAEYERQHERACIAVGRTPALRPRAEATCRAWLSILLRLGGTHPHADRWIAEEQYEAPGWTPYDWQRVAAWRLARLETIHKVLTHAKGQAFTQALGHPPRPGEVAAGTADGGDSPHCQTPQFHRFNQLKQLARHLGCLTPVLEAIPQIERKAA